jgi:hypothetical protein
VANELLIKRAYTGRRPGLVGLEARYLPGGFNENYHNPVRTACDAVEIRKEYN